jgi:hypothetical protein
LEWAPSFFEPSYNIHYKIMPIGVRVRVRVRGRVRVLGF